MQIQIPADFKRPPFPKKEGAAFAYNAFLRFPFYLNTFWFFYNILKFELYKNEIYAASPTGYLSPGITIHLDDIYSQLDDFLQKATAAKNISFEESLAKTYQENAIRNRNNPKNIFVPTRDSFLRIMVDVGEDLTRVQEDSKKYKNFWNATIEEYDKMNARTANKLLQLLFARAGYIITVNKQKNLFAAKKDEESFEIQGKKLPHEKVEELISSLKAPVDYTILNSHFIRTVLDIFHHYATLS